MPAGFKKKDYPAPPLKSGRVKGEGHGGGGPVQHDGRANDRGGANYEKGGKRDFEERVYKKGK